MNPIFSFLIFTLNTTTSAFASFHNCNRNIPGLTVPTYYVQKNFCDENKTLRMIKFYFKSTEKVGVQFNFNEFEQLLEYRTYDSDANQVQFAEYTPLEDGTYQTRKNQEIEHKPSYFISTVKLHFDPHFHEEILNSTFYRDDKKFLTEFYRTDSNSFMLIDRLLTYKKNGEIDQDFRIDSVPGPKNTILINQFSILDSQNRLIGGFKKNSPIQLSKTASLKKPAVIIDTGFDYTHPQLRNKIAEHSGYGIFPGFRIGWVQDPMGHLDRPFTADELYFQIGAHNPYVPFSHGTHVAGIAMRDVEQFGMIAFGGDFTNVEYLSKISQWLKTSGTRFANMSFAYGDQENPFGASQQSRDALISLMSHNSNTLFFVAAGNQKSDLDPSEKTDVPPKAPVKNKIVTAALDIDILDLKNLESYRLADFSNYGDRTVDFASPGKSVLSQNIGGTEIRLSGTSMASPYTMNVFLKMSEINANLSWDDLKKIAYCTVFIPKTHSLPVISKGILIKERALLATKKTKEGMSINEACASSANEMPL